MAYVAVTDLEVRMWGQLVGYLNLDERYGVYGFEYEPAWRRGQVEIAPLSMPLRGPASQIFPNLNHDTYQRLPPFIADALPDAFGNSLIDAALAERGVQVTQITPLDKLAYVGSRAMGALEFQPHTGPEQGSLTAIDLRELRTQAQQAVIGNLSTANGISDALSHLLAVGTSAGGARAKAVISYDPATGEMHTAAATNSEGSQQWLLKFDGANDAKLASPQTYGRTEYAYYLMASDAGITMNESKLLEHDGFAHFMTRRFDRSEGPRRHVQTLCAMAQLDFNLLRVHSYDQYLETITALGMGPRALQEGFRRMVFNVMSANCDDHTKNFSFLLDAQDPTQWQLAPAYDVCHSYDPHGAWVSAHLIGVNGSFLHITRKDLLAVADRHRVAQARAIITQVADAITRWPDFADQAGLFEKRTAEIRADFAISYAG